MTELTYGFYNFQDYVDSKVTEVGVEQIMNAVMESALMYNEQATQLLNTLTFPTTSYKYVYENGFQATLSPATENSTPRPVGGASRYELAHPLQGGEIAWGGNFISLAHMTVEKAFSQTLAMFKADANWLKRHLFASILTKTTYTFEDEEHGSLTIKPLANNDTDTYLTAKGVLTTANHYLGQAGAIADDANPFPTIHSTLKNWMDNIGSVVVYIADNLTATVEALSDFYELPDTNLQYGDDTTLLIRNSGDSIPLFGGTYIGYTNKCHIVELKDLPDNYMFAIDTDGGRQLVARREYAPDSLRGFVNINGYQYNDKNTQINFYRAAGFSPIKRVGGLAYHIGNATYQNPAANYVAPLAV